MFEEKKTMRIADVIPFVGMGIAGILSLVDVALTGHKMFLLAGGMQLFVAGIWFEEFLEKYRRA